MFNKNIKFILLIKCLFFIFIKKSEEANILVISPALSLSLIYKMGHLADLLVNAGHNVTVFIPEMDNIEETGTKFAQKIIRMKGLFNVIEQITNFDAFNEEISSYSARRSEDEGMVIYCESILKKKDELEILKNSNFDLAFSNMIDYCLQGIIKYLGIEKQIWISTGPLPEGPLWFLGKKIIICSSFFIIYLGIPLPLSISPLLQETTMLGPKMNMMERATNIWQFALSWYSFMQTLRKVLLKIPKILLKIFKENELFRSYISPNFPSLDKVLSQVDLAFVYNDEFLDPALPTLPKVISIGGLGIKPANYSINKLGIKIVKAIESGKKGTIIFSMGSITDTKSLNKEKWQNILKAFSYFEEYSFIVKISAADKFTQEYTKNMPNIHLFEWFPQSDLLGHPKIRLFITHGGYNSLIESTIRGVPVLIIPLFFDQLRNSKCAEYRGNGRILIRKDLLNLEKIKEKINEMLINISYYKQNSQRLSNLHNQKPNRPEEAIIKWTEFVISNGPLKEMIPETVNLSLIEYLCLDILFFILIIIILIILILIKIIKKLIINLFFTKKHKKD
ncbi:unnamed protein product [Meloidogyne enterolobii]|uniref:Uncharacterized protein n=1 Tax=Meloidogyne enterolobii TaxID=390850 RepID=A0ACB0XVS0_MELEN